MDHLNLYFQCVPVHEYQVATKIFLFQNQLEKYLQQFWTKPLHIQKSQEKQI